MASRRAGRVATDAIDTDVIEAFRSQRADRAIVFFTDATAIARILSGTSGCVFLTQRQIRARSQGTRDIARLTRARAGAVTANAVDTHSAAALRVERTSKPHGEFHHASTRTTRTIAGLRARAGIVRIPRRDDGANAEKTRDIASFAVLAAGAIAAITFDAKTALAIGSRGTSPSIGFLASARCIADASAAALRTCSFGRIRRYSGCADVFGARLVIDWQIRIFAARDDIALIVAFNDFAIARGLSCRKIGSRGGE